MPPVLPRPGAVASIRHERWLIARAEQTANVARVEAIRLGAATALPVTFFAPFDDIVISGTPQRTLRPRRVRRQRWRAELAALRAHAAHVRLPLAALPAAIDVLPYQLEPVFALRDGHRRVLLADAVGLGKTIQAGLVIAELLRRREATRIVIATPGSLCEQWCDELRDRFALTARLADAATLKTLVASLPRHTPPLGLDGVWISSIDFLKQAHILATLPPMPWDLVVIDEAHTVSNQSERRQAADTLTRNARRVLLLSATPVSGLDDGRGLIQLGALEPAEPLVVIRRDRSDVGLRSHRRTRRIRVDPSPAERRAFDALDAFARVATAAATASTADATQLLVSIFQKRALSTFAALSLSLSRRLTHLADEPVAFVDAIQPVFDFGDDDGEGLYGAIGLGIERERSWLRRMRAAADAAAADSRKIRWLTRLLGRTQEPVIVFTEFRDSLDVARRACEQTLHVVVAHGAQTVAERQASLRAFQGGDARVLIATDVASQGLNLHYRSRWVIHLDLPWNPIRLEQRAGRVDRIGQTRDVHVTQLVLGHARDRAFAARLAHRAERAANADTLPADSQWRLRARAAAPILEERRHLARRWRGTMPIGRPRVTKPGSRERDGIYVTDVGGVEEAVGAVPSARAIAARARRVDRVEAARLTRALRIERALLARLSASRGTDAARLPARQQLTLPGAVTAADTRASDAQTRAMEAARDAIRARIAEIEARIAAPPTVTSTLRGVEEDDTCA